MHNTAIKAKRPGNDRALGAEALDGAQEREFYPHYRGFPPVCQPSTVRALEREAAYHRDRAQRFAALADIAWRFGDPVNRRKMQYCQWQESRLLDAVVRVLLSVGEVCHE